MVCLLFGGKGKGWGLKIDIWIFVFLKRQSGH